MEQVNRLPQKNILPFCTDSNMEKTRRPIENTKRTDKMRNKLSSLASSLSVAPYAAAVTSAVERGHGVLAEKANHFVDVARGRAASHVGSDNSLNGADRIVDGVKIQTKYCSSGSKCIASCFEGGSFRYMSNGRPMQIEVPKDLHSAAVQAMRVRIEQGQVPGITDPEQASRLVRKGHLTYRQSLNLGKAGTCESLSYDIARGAVAGAWAFSLSALTASIGEIRKGKSKAEIATKTTATALKGAALTVTTTVITSQIARTAVDRMIAPASRAITDQMSYNTLSRISVAFGRSGLKGAAAKSFVTKAIRGNIIAFGVTTSISATVDGWRYYKGQITASDLKQMVTTKTAANAAGSVGWIYGAAAGAAAGSFVPGPGTILGGMLGGLGGSLLAGGIASKSCDIAFTLTARPENQKPLPGC